jgi:uncharacterized protein
MTQTSDKMRKLREVIRGTRGLLVAFSGGLDSTLVAAVARQELGDRSLAVTALSPTYPKQEQDAAEALARQIGIRHQCVESNELEIPGFAENPRNRCYYCKSELFTRLRKVADAHGLEYVADGSNMDDLSDHRPGREAARECGVISPLLDAGMDKAAIREASRALGLATAGKPSLACLASRFPYGSRITSEKLVAVDQIETALRGLGFRQIRVRHHGDIARIELEPPDIARAASEELRPRIVAIAKAAGFVYVSLDLQGYRTGSMNEA